MELADKVVLEIGSGRGGTTRELVAALSGQPGARLIITDISDAHFERLTETFRDSQLDIAFVRTDACELTGIDEGSIDYVVCNYTLCAINSRPGRAALALQRFWRVLRPGGPSPPHLKKKKGSGYFSHERGHAKTGSGCSSRLGAKGSKVE